jgi:sRNA-binding protein
MAKMLVTDRDGHEHELEGREGVKLMETLREYGARYHEERKRAKQERREERRRAKKEKKAREEEERKAGHAPAPSPQATAALPPGWQQMTDVASGRVYYGNPATGATQWERPAMPSAAKVLFPATALPRPNFIRFAGCCRRSHPRQTRDRKSTRLNSSHSLFSV